MNLQQFLNTRNITEPQKVVISNRIVIDDKPAEFTIRAINETEAEEIMQRCVSRTKKGSNLNNSRYMRLVAIEGTIDPNFKDSDSLNQLGCATPEDYIKKVLLPGEIAVLAEKILDVSGYNSLDSLKEQAKN